MELVSWSGLHKLFGNPDRLCDHQEKYNKDELTRAAGGRIKEVEEILVDDFRPIGESITTTKLRAQEERFQKASAALSDEVSTSVM